MLVADDIATSAILMSRTTLLEIKNHGIHDD